MRFLGSNIQRCNEDGLLLVRSCEGHQTLIERFVIVLVTTRKKLINTGRQFHFCLVPNFRSQKISLITKSTCTMRLFNNILDWIL